MFFLNFLFLFLCFVIGFLFLNVQKTDFINLTRLHFYTLLASFSSLIFFQIQTQNTCLFLLCSPLFISFFPKFKLWVTHEKRRQHEHQTCLIFLNLLALNLKIGLSFEESLRRSSSVFQRGICLKTDLKKNVVLQQPKSRFSPLFRDLEHDLQALQQQKFRKSDLISSFIKKYETNFKIENKIRVATTQYRVQSLVLLIFWFLALVFLYLQNLHGDYKKTIGLSFILMLLGFYFARKLLVKSRYRI